jgi:hypothetical protein
MESFQPIKRLEGKEEEEEEVEVRTELYNVYAM